MSDHTSPHPDDLELDELGADQHGRFAAVVEFSPRIANPPIEPGPSNLSRLIDAAVSPLWWWTSKHVDDWGRDNDLTNVAWRLAQLRWDFSVAGAEHIDDGAGLVVVNQRWGSWAPLWSALALGAAIDRPVRFAGRPELPLVGPFLQRIGGLLELQGDIAGALRDGQLVVVGARPTATDHTCGEIEPRIVDAALSSGAPIYAAATASSMVGREARIDVAPMRGTSRRVGPLATVELAELLQQQISASLGYFGAQSDLAAVDVLAARRRGEQ